MQTFSAGSLSESLHALQGSELLANGCVNLIGLDAIRDRAGPMWPRKQELVWEFTAKKLQERLGPHDLLLRVDDTTFLVAVVTDYASAAQAVCLRVLEEVLLHFIGHLDRADIRLRRVEDIRDGEVVSSSLDPTRIPKLEDAPRSSAAMAPDPVREAEKNPLLFKSVSGRVLRVDFAPRPVTSLQHGVLTALHLSQAIVDTETNMVLGASGRDDLTDADLIRIDEASLDYASLFAMGDQAAGYVALIIPVSYRTLLNRRGRAALIAHGAGSVALKTGGLFEIIDMDLGTPPSRMDEAVSMARTLCRGALARLPERHGSLTPFAGIGFAGLTVPLSRQGTQAMQTVRLLASRSESLKRSFRAMIALDAPAGSAERLRALGFTHSSTEVAFSPSASPTPDRETLPAR